MQENDGKRPRFLPLRPVLCRGFPTFCVKKLFDFIFLEKDVWFLKATRLQPLSRDES